MIAVASCEKKSKLQADIERLESVPIRLPLNEMKRFDDMGLTGSQFPKKNKFSIVVFSDSLSCSSCELSRIHFWDDLLDEMRDKGNVDVYFIFSPPKEEALSVEQSLSISQGKYNAYLDTANVFLHYNPNIPTDPTLHCFLLDEDGNVLLVGNPIQNKKVNKMLWDILEDGDSD